MKTPGETFAGADISWTCEGMMLDGKAVQMGTSHLLGQNFARVFETQFLTETGEQEFVWQTSWGVSTRLVGALIMGHGDDNGLCVPPRLAPVQVVVLVVRDEEGVGERAAALAQEVRDAGARVEVDARVATSFGRRPGAVGARRGGAGRGTAGRAERQRPLPPTGGRLGTRVARRSRPRRRRRPVLLTRAAGRGARGGRYWVPHQTYVRLMPITACH